MRFTEILKAEHRTIGKVAEACGVLAEELQNGMGVPTNALLSLVEFLGMYAEQYHYQKEKWLLSMLPVKGVPAANCPIAR